MPVLWPMMKLAAVILLPWFLPLSLFYLLVGDFHFWRGLALFFTKTAFVTIGGSYTVLPYVAKVAVLKLHWLTRLQMMDGFALAETTPGPLIIVVAFVGFLAGYNHFHGSLWMELWVCWQRPSIRFCHVFFFAFAGAALVEGTQDNPMIGGVLELIIAVVVGAILDPTLFLGNAVIFPSRVAGLNQLNAISLSGMIVSLLLLQ